MTYKIIEKYRGLTKKEKFDFWIMLMIHVLFLIVMVRMVMVGLDIHKGNIEPIFSFEQMEGIVVILFGLSIPLIASYIFTPSRNYELEKRIKDLEKKVSELEKKS